MKQTTVDKKKAKGTFRPGRLQTVDGVDFENSVDLTPPDELQNPRAIEEWNNLAPQLSEKKLLSFPDRKLLAAYCIEIAKYFDCVNSIEELGSIIPLKNSKGKVVNYMKNPHYDLADKALKNSIAIGAHFGLTPASRGKLKVGEKPKATPEEQAMDKLNMLRKKSGAGKVVQLKTA